MLLLEVFLAKKSIKSSRRERFSIMNISAESWDISNLLLSSSMITISRSGYFLICFGVYFSACKEVQLNAKTYFPIE